MSALSVRFDYDDLAKSAKRAAVGLLMFVGVVSVAHCGSGCRPAIAAQAEAEYTAKILACSKYAATKAEAAACRRQVNAEFGLCEREAWPRITPCDGE